MSALRFPLATSVMVRTNSTRLPSGEICGSATRTAPIKSRMVIGRAASAGDETSSEATATSKALIAEIVSDVRTREPENLFPAKRDERIDPHRPPRRHVAGDEGDQRQES